MAGCATDADAGALVEAGDDALVLSWMSGTNGSLADMRRIARIRFATLEVVPSDRFTTGAGVATAATGVEALLEVDLECFSSFGSSKASIATSTTARPTRISFLRRSAASRASARRPFPRISIA